MLMANGVCKFDMDFTTDYVEPGTVEEWMVDLIWDSLLNVGDANGDGELSDSEWQIIRDSVAETAAPLPLDAPVGLFAPEDALADFILPSGMEAVSVAGETYNEVFKNGSTASMRRMFPGGER